VARTEDALAAVIVDDAPEPLGPTTPERAAGAGVRGPADVVELVAAVAVDMAGATVAASGSAHEDTPRACFRR
jgi:hypothetical protein